MTCMEGVYSGMKRVLLIGQTGDIIRSIYEGLCEEFLVQLCNEPQIDLIRSMERATNPALIIFCQIGIKEVDVAFFLWVKQYRPYIPVVVITTTDKWGEIADYCDTNQFTRLMRPVKIREIKETCLTIFNRNKTGVDDEEPEALEEVVEKRKTKILVVDDSAIFLRSIKDMLNDKYDIELANSGEKALKKIPLIEPDLVLMDYEMEGMSGKETFETMLSDDYMKDVPVIFLTSVRKKDKVFDVLEIRPAGYVLKPPDKNLLLEEISKVTNYV